MTIHGIGRRSICRVDGAGTPSQFYRATAARSGRTYLVVMSPYKIGATRAARVSARSMGRAAICTLKYNAALTGSVDLFYSDTGYVSPGRGRNQSIWFEGRVTQPLRMTWTLPVVPEAGRRVALEVSGLELLNADGAMDSLVDSFDITGRAITVLFGLAGYAFDDFVPIWSGRALGWTRDLGKLQVTARDAGYLLDLPLQTAIYGGAGGADGNAALANKPKPVCFGICRKVTPQAVDPANLVYQVHSRAIAGVDAVYDKGVALVATTDYASYALLAAAVPGVGKYATCLAAGMIKLGAAPAGGVTMDVRGDAVGSYVATTATIMKRLLSDFAGISAGSIDATGFSLLDVAVPGTIGWFKGSEVISAQSAMSEIAGHCSAWWGALPDGRFTVGRVEAPAEAALTIEYQAGDIEDVEIIAAPDGTSPPRYRQRVGYQRNWTVQQPSDLAGAVSATDVLAASQPYLITADLNANTQADFLMAQDPPVLESLFDLAADAMTEATRLKNLLGVQRQAVRVRLDPTGHRVARGSCVALTTPRINGGARWLARVIGSDIDASKRTVDLILWG